MVPRISLLLVLVASLGHAQNACPDAEGHIAAAHVSALQKELKNISVEEMDTDIPPRAQETMRVLKDATTEVADAMLRCASPASEPQVLQLQIASLLNANPAEPPDGVIDANDHRYDEASGGYGHNLRVAVSRISAELLAVRFSINIECGHDTQLLIYERSADGWKRRLRWQSNHAQKISDAFGDFFLYQLVPSTTSGTPWRIAIARGAPWCTSRISLFRLELITPGDDTDSARLLWHTDAIYSRGDFAPVLKTSPNALELRINRPTIDAEGYETRTIYRYTILDSNHIERISPIGLNARGFVDAWASAPWSEAKNFVAPEATEALKQVHDNLDASLHKDNAPPLAVVYGPVRPCTNARLFQVQFDLDMIANNRTEHRRSIYFHMREVKDGYQLLSASATSDPACKGPDLMRTNR